MNKVEVSSDCGLVAAISWDTEKITQDVIDDMVATVDLWAKRVTRGIKKKDSDGEENVSGPNDAPLPMPETPNAND